MTVIGAFVRADREDGGYATDVVRGQRRALSLPLSFGDNRVTSRARVVVTPRLTPRTTLSPARHVVLPATRPQSSTKTGR